MVTGRPVNTKFRDQLKADISAAFAESEIAKTAFENLWQKLLGSSIDQLEFINQLKVTPRQLLVLRQVPELYRIADLRDQGRSLDEIRVNKLKIMKKVIKVRSEKIDTVKLDILPEKAVYREAVNRLFLETPSKSESKLEADITEWNSEMAGRTKRDSEFARDRASSKMLLKHFQAQSEVKLEIAEANKEKAEREAKEKLEQARQEKERLKRERDAKLKDIEADFEQAAQALSQHQQSQANPVALASAVQATPASVSTEQVVQAHSQHRQSQTNPAVLVSTVEEKHNPSKSEKFARALFDYALYDAKNRHVPRSKFKAPSALALVRASALTSSIGLPGGAIAALVLFFSATPVVGWAFGATIAGLAVASLLVLGTGLLLRNAKRRYEVARNLKQFTPGLQEKLFKQNTRFRHEATCLNGLSRSRRMQLLAAGLLAVPGAKPVNNEIELTNDENSLAAPPTHPKKALLHQHKKIHYHLNVRTGGLFLQPEGGEREPVGTSSHELQETYRRLAGG